MNKYRAFTLIELMVTLAVFAILVMAAVPSLNSYSTNNKLVTDTNSLASALNLARSEAVKRRRNVTVCKSSDGATCGGNTVSWSNGWIVFVNLDNDSPAVVDGGEDLIRIYGATTSNNTLTVSPAMSAFVTYSPAGFSNAQGSFILCTSHGASSARVVTIKRTGQPVFSKGGGTCTAS